MALSETTPDQRWFVYMIRCSDNTIYTGITNNLLNRVSLHNSVRGGAKYTRGRQPVTLIYFEEHPDRSSAGRRETLIKKFPKKTKESLAERFECAGNR